MWPKDLMFISQFLIKLTSRFCPDPDVFRDIFDIFLRVKNVCLLV